MTLDQKLYYVSVLFIYLSLDGDWEFENLFNNLLWTAKIIQKAKERKKKPCRRRGATQTCDVVRVIHSLHPSSEVRACGAACPICDDDDDESGLF